LSFSSAQAWKDIYGSRPGHQIFVKGRWYERLSIYASQGVRSLVTEPDPSKHAAMIRVFGGAFSRGFLNEMEPMIIDYIVSSLESFISPFGNFWPHLLLLAPETLLKSYSLW
jgi:hypothetical protein